MMKSQEQVASAKADGPGAQLRNARTARGLSIDDVARSLNLSPRHIAAIEDEDYQSLPAPTYVRGYLRSYAQLLELSPDKLVAAYQRLPASSRRVDLTAPASVERELTSSHALMKLGTAVVAVVVFGLAAVWWSNHDAGSPVASEGTEVAATHAEETAGGGVERGPETTQAKPDSPTPSPVAAPTITVVDKSAPAPESRKPEPASATSAPVPTPSSVVVEPDAPHARLTLYVHDDSWADVRDARQQRLVYETVPAGRVLTLDGVPPFNVFLGNVDGVRVEVNGRAYDAAKHKRGQVARFTVNPPPTP